MPLVARSPAGLPKDRVHAAIESKREACWRGASFWKEKRMTAEAYAEVIGTPYSTWLAPVGTDAPAIDTDEADFDPAWVELGTNGIMNQGSDGVTVNLGRTTQDFTPAGGTLPVKSWTTDEKLTVAFSLVDVSVEQFAAVMDDAAVTTISAASGAAGQKRISLVRGIAVKYYALLVRGISPYDDGTGLSAQYEFTRVYQSGSQAPKYLKGTPAELACEFTICGDINDNDPAQYAAEEAART
jgi:hypothetical protein